jgi:DNA-directed RNA polymerase specialized sigma subunit
MQGRKSLISKEEVLSTLQRLSTELGRAPTREELEQMSGISPAVVRKHFTRHRTAVRAAGLEPCADRAGTDDPKRRPAGGLGPGNARAKTDAYTD